jgi:hypothetical protein|tara:strand:+ start:199 stop:519 length:321 start_codon:yes stop_codon:yes gene_type:complete
MIEYTAVLLAAVTFFATAGLATAAFTRLGKEPGATLTIIGSVLLFVLTAVGLLFRFFVIPKFYQNTDISNTFASTVLEIYGLVYATLHIIAIALLGLGMFARSRQP